MTFVNPNTPMAIASSNRGHFSISLTIPNTRNLKNTKSPGLSPNIAGSLAYDTDEKTVYFSDGQKWTKLAKGSSLPSNTPHFIDAISPGGSDIDLRNYKITNVSLPEDPGDVTTKEYVDSKLKSASIPIDPVDNQNANVVDRKTLDVLIERVKNIPNVYNITTEEKETFVDNQKTIPNFKILIPVGTHTKATITVTLSLCCKATHGAIVLFQNNSPVNLPKGAVGKRKKVIASIPSSGNKEFEKHILRTVTFVTTVSIDPAIENTFNIGFEPPTSSDAVYLNQTADGADIIKNYRSSSCMSIVTFS